MSATQFQLLTDWSFDAPRDAVWRALLALEEWPSWWRAVARVEYLAAGEANGIGAHCRMTWRTALPCSLTFDVRTTRVEPMTMIEARADGELSGVGRCTLVGGRAGERTHVRYAWTFELTRPWIRLAAPTLRPLFAWNHIRTMRRGEAGLRRKLAASSSPAQQVADTTATRRLTIY
jgi:uncharacterized protein YndB with AHSA1/START domain